MTSHAGNIIHVKDSSSYDFLLDILYTANDDIQPLGLVAFGGRGVVTFTCYFHPTIDQWKINMLMNLGLTIFEEVGLLRVGLFFSEGLLLSGGHYYQDLQAATIF